MLPVVLIRWLDFAQGASLALSAVSAVPLVRAPSPPPTAVIAAPATGPITPTTFLYRGQSLQILSGSVWYAGTVVAMNTDQTVRVHFTGYSSSEDENVPRTRLRWSGPLGYTPSVPTTPSITVSVPLPATARPVDDTTALSAGTPVYILSGSQWYRGFVVSFARHNRVRITYAGWGSQYDENVPRTKLRLP